MFNKNDYEPLYVQIRKDIEEKILDGTIQIGGKLMSEAQMIRYYDVGRATVRTALSELVSSGCLKKEQGAGTFCVALPKRDSKKKIDVLLNMADTYFIPFFLAGISRVLTARNCNLVLHDTCDSMDCIAQTLTELLAQGTDGILVQPYTGSDDLTYRCHAAVALCRERNIPLITLDGKFREIDIPCLMNDDNMGGMIATEYLIQMGHRNILGLFRERYKDSRFRMTGYLNAIAAAGLTPFIRDADQSSFEEIMAYIRKNHITAVFFYNDLLAVDYYHRLDEAGVKVPRDLSVVSYDDTELSITSIPQMTSVTHPKDEMGEKAALHLLDMIDGKSMGPRQYLFAPTIAVRDSVAKLV